MRRKLGISVALGLLSGAALGLLLGVLTNQFAIWPSLGAGIGLMAGIVIGILQDSKKK